MISPIDLAALVSERDTERYRDARGVRLPSVTEIIALAGLIDFSGVPMNLLEAGAERGRRVHQLTAYYDLAIGEAVKDHDLTGIGGYFDGWLKFLHETRFEPTQIETPLVGRSFAGTPDRIGWFPHSKIVRSLPDIKTGVKAEKWWQIQVAGYQILAEEILGWKCARLSVQLFNVPPYYKLHPYPNDAKDRADFMACLRVARWKLDTGMYTLP